MKSGSRGGRRKPSGRRRPAASNSTTRPSTGTRTTASAPDTRADDPLWYKDAVIYELHVRAFSDSNGDGVGDFRGLIGRLDYLQELGVTAIWLLPFFPSPLRDDGYDIADYCDVHPSYGTVRDFRDFLKAAHARGIRVIIELVVNHTSAEHAWFQRARQAKPGSNARDYYVWSDDPRKYRDARIIFQDFESSNWSWDPVARQYYWHRFYSHQPDLNFDNPSVQRELIKVAGFWFGMGVDGMRLDAVPYLYEREGTNCENLPETHAFLRRLRKHVDRTFRNKMLLAEANQWPEDAAAYFGRADECHMAFHFPLMPRLFMAVQMEDSFPIVDILRSTPFIEQSCQWATFLRNHDELTLEMVTDQERDYMVRAYAQDPKMKINQGIRRRLAPLLGKNHRKIELLNVLLFSFPGTPVVYYGDELGMGDNFYLGDRDGVRTPMQWSPDRNAGFSSVNPQQLYLPVIADPEYHHEAINVENQARNLSSLLWWMKRVIAMRKRFKCLSRGSMQIVRCDNPKVLCFVRTYENETLLVVANLSRFSQMVSIELSAYAGYVSEEVFSGNEFGTIGKRPHILTITPHGHYWFRLRRHRKEVQAYDSGLLPTLTVENGPEDILHGAARAALAESILPGYLGICRWFGAKSRKIRKAAIVEALRFGTEGHFAVLLLVEIHFALGDAETYLLPVSWADEQLAETIRDESPQTVIARVECPHRCGILYDSTADIAFHRAVYGLMAGGRKIAGERGTVVGRRGPSLDRSRAVQPPQSNLLRAEQSNSSIRFGDSYFLKLYRKLDKGTNPEVELLQFLTQKGRFAGSPRFAGCIEYHTGAREPATLAILQSFVRSDGDGWNYFLGLASHFYDQMLSTGAPPSASACPASPFDVRSEEIPEPLPGLIGATALSMAAVLGRRTGELHRALGAAPSGSDFCPEPSGMLYQRSLYQSMQALATRAVDTLASSRARLPDELQDLARQVHESRNRIRARLRAITTRKLGGQKIRIHGDYHLGQVLRTGDDFLIIDFEGEPARSLGERKLKYSPFKDVAGMVRSFHYCAQSLLLLKNRFRPEDVAELQKWCAPWYTYVAGAFLEEYRATMGDSPVIPGGEEEQRTLLDVFLLEKAVYELLYELNNRPHWAAIPMQGILSILAGRG